MQEKFFDNFSIDMAPSTVIEKIPENAIPSKQTLKRNISMMDSNN